MSYYIYIYLQVVCQILTHVKSELCKCLQTGTLNVSQSVSSSLGHCSPELWHSISVWLLYRFSAHFPYITFEKSNTLFM